MKIGLVKFLNARPLDRGMILEEKTSPDLSLLPETPANLAKLLLAGDLDAALISSVEWIRNKETLSYCNRVGVCATNRVDSILFLESREAPASPSFSHLERIYVDRGSRSSIALLQILLKEAGARPDLPFVERDPREIADSVDERSGGLIIGDTALDFFHSPRAPLFRVRDLARWWNETQNLPFVFAVWAYPRNRPIPDAFFLDSYAAGKRDLDRIVEESGLGEAARVYLKETLHYEIKEPERLALERYESLLKTL